MSGVALAGGATGGGVAGRGRASFIKGVTLGSFKDGMKKLVFTKS